MSTAPLFLWWALAVAHPGTLELTERDAMIQSVDTESAAATGLYVGGGLSIALGGALGGFAFSQAIPDGPAPSWTGPVFGLGVGLLLAGLISIPIAIGLDVDSGSRRGALRVALGAGGLSLAF